MRYPVCQVILVTDIVQDLQKQMERLAEQNVILQRYLKGSLISSQWTSGPQYCRGCVQNDARR